MDEMSVPDLNIMTKYLEFAETANWERTRQIMLCSLKPYLKKKNMTADEFFPLPVDERWSHKQEMTTELDKDALDWFKTYKENYDKQTKEGK